MKIAHIVPNHWPYPPQHHNGRLFVVQALIDGQLKAGHKVSLYASEKAKTPARLVSIPQPRVAVEDIRKEEMFLRQLNATLIAKLYEEGDQYDIIHSHFDIRHLYFTPFTKTPTVTTIHWPLSKRKAEIIRLFKNKNFYFTPTRKIKKIPGVPLTRPVYNGIDVDAFHPSYDQGKYLAYLGRMRAGRGVDVACKIAKRTKKKLILAGKISRQDEEYFATKIKPHIDGRQIRYIGELPYYRVNKFLREAEALLFPIILEEAFGLVIVEALASGTPVIGSRLDPLPEFIQNGKNGFTCSNMNQMVKAVRELSTIDRRVCRKRAEKFSIDKMVDGYESLYQQIIQKKKK